MIEKIGSQNMQETPPVPRINFRLSDEQKKTAEEIIGQYDPEKMTADKDKQMRAELRDAGIQPGEDLKNLLTEAGFQVGPPEGRKTQEMRPPMNLSPELQNTINNFTEKFREGLATDDDLNDLLQMFYQNGLSSQGNFVDRTS